MKVFSDHPLLEREGELAAISSTLADVARGSGSCLTLEGAAGVGKTRLLESARRGAQDEGFRVLAARAGEREREYAWGVVHSLFAPVVNSASPDELESLWAGSAASCRALLVEGATFTEQEPSSSFVIFSGLMALAANIAEEEPLLLAVDDLHWLDGPSLGFLDFLARRIERLPIALLSTVRPNEPGADVALIASLTAEQNGATLHPRPLTAEGSAEALRSRLGPDARESLLREGHEVTGGNPLLLTELARTVDVDGGGLAAGSLPGSLARLGPRAVGRTVEVRLARAGEGGRRLAFAAAVLGEEVSLSQAIALAELDAATADRAALDLVNLELLRPGSRVQFVHPVIRAAVYESAGAPEQQRVHGRASALLREASAPAERIANHLLELDPCGDQETVAILREAAVKAAAGGDSRAATRLMRRAFCEPPAEEIRTDVMTQLGTAELLVDGPSAVEHLGGALEMITEPSYEAAIAELLARALTFQERTAEAIAVCERSLRSMERAGEPGLRRRLEATLIEAILAGGSAAGEQDLRRAAALLRDRCDGEDYGARALLSLSMLAATRDLSMSSAQAVEVARQAAEGGVLIREGTNSVAQLGPPQTLALAGFYAESITLLNESLAWNERHGSSFGYLSDLIWRARSLLQAGQLEPAIADSDEALRLSEAYRISVGVAWASATLVEACLLSGDRDRARAVADSAARSDAGTPAGWHWTNLMVARARLDLADGDAEAARAQVREAADIYAASYGVATTWLSWRPTAADAELALGDRAAARALASDELTLARQWGAPRAIGIGLRSMAAAAEGGEQRELLLREAVEVLEPSEARLTLAEAQVDLGATLRRANRKAESRDLLRAGMDNAHDCGAAVLAERARSELRASGVRARRTALSGPESLTESERRVVDLAAAGRTNKEIAAELFVTVKTVEVHLSNAYRKLEIKGRRNLSAALSAA